MKNIEWRRRGTLIALILGAIIGAAIGYYNGLFGWHNPKAIVVSAIIGALIGAVAQRAKTNEVARKLFHAVVIGGLIGIVFAVIAVSFSVESKEYFGSEVINWCVSGMIVGLFLPTRLTISMRIGSTLGLAAALASGINHFAQQSVEAGIGNLLISNYYVFLMIEVAAGMLIGAWFGRLVEMAFTRKEHA